MTYKEALDYLAGLGKFGSQLGLTRIEYLLGLMQHPERRYKTIHVTGTNGKGSTTAMLAGILTESGIKTGMFTSPHLVHYTERMVVNGKQISQTEFAKAIEYTSRFVAQMVQEGYEHPTEFEVLTAAAFYYFAKAKVEYAVIEVGLGGLLDSTNVIVPEVSVITNVTFEHADRCGGTLEGVARHKAGIIKEGVPVVTAAKGEALEIIRRTAQKKAAALLVADEDFVVDHNESNLEGQKFTLSQKDGQAKAYQVKLLGWHQAANAALAIMTAKMLKHKQITAKSIQNGLRSVSWPGRFEILKTKPLMVIDGAHNPAGAKVLRENLDVFFPKQQRTFLLGILQDKDITGIIKTLIRPKDQVVVAAPLSDRAGQPETVAAGIMASHVEIAPSIEEGLRRAQELAGEEGLVCAAGSLYLIGTVCQMLFR
ncbi:MAG: bifunctional folylpolyglutamate synthase/dihydrofolate synthase [Pelosinus sp.]|nr:bifunctional folylpolyglutamate synthase/dihydrofolate synthase [Pelosinus sp.]